MTREERRLIRFAKEDFLLLIRYIEKFNGTFEELKKELNGYNSVRNNFFETDFSNINALVCYNSKEKEIEVSPIVKIWDNDNHEYIKINGSSEINLNDYKYL